MKYGKPEASVSEEALFLSVEGNNVGQSLAQCLALTKGSVHVNYYRMILP